MDFESPYSAEQAVKALQNQGIQAQMAKVCITEHQILSYPGNMNLLMILCSHFEFTSVLSLFFSLSFS